MPIRRERVSWMKSSNGDAPTGDSRRRREEREDQREGVGDYRDLEMWSQELGGRAERRWVERGWERLCLAHRLTVHVQRGHCASRAEAERGGGLEERASEELRCEEC